MQMTVAASDDAEAEIAMAALYPHMSLYVVQPRLSTSPLDDAATMISPNGWSLTSPTNIQYTGRTFDGMSAICYQTGRRLYDALNGTVPIGLVDSSYSGSPIEWWAANNDICGPIRDRTRLSQCYNAMLWPIRHIQPTAVLWYQGQPTLRFSFLPPGGCPAPPLTAASTFFTPLTVCVCADGCR